MEMNLSLIDEVEMQRLQELESRVNGATPYALVAMLFDAAIRNVMIARTCMEQGDTWGREEAIDKTIAVIDEGLVVGLNLEAGGDLAQNLKALYDYMSVKLLQANLQNNMQALDEVAALLGHLKVGWDGIADQPIVAAS